MLLLLGSFSFEWKDVFLWFALKLHHLIFCWEVVSRWGEKPALSFFFFWNCLSRTTVPLVVMKIKLLHVFIGIRAVILLFELKWIWRSWNFTEALYISFFLFASLQDKWICQCAESYLLIFRWSRRRTSADLLQLTTTALLRVNVDTTVQGLALSRRWVEPVPNQSRVHLVSMASVRTFWVYSSDYEYERVSIKVRQSWGNAKLWSG